MSAPDWFIRLQSLVLRFPELGITGDLSMLTMAEAWGLYLFLSRLADGA